MEWNHKQEHYDKEMMMIQANIDDMNPELCPHISERLMDQGANDVFWIPIIMKKGRPGLMLNVLVHRDCMVPVEEVIFRETTTLGLRYTETTCHRLAREFVQVDTRWGAVTVKVGFWRGEEVQYSPEYRECEQIAKAWSVPLKQVYDEVRRCYLAEHQQRG